MHIAFNWAHFWPGGPHPAPSGLAPPLRGRSKKRRRRRATEQERRTIGSSPFETSLPILGMALCGHVESVAVEKCRTAASRERLASSAAAILPPFACEDRLAVFPFGRGV
jgi:hypothetical protein